MHNYFFEALKTLSGFVPKSRFKQQNDFAIIFSTKENVTFYRLWDDTPVIFSNYEGQEISSGSSLPQNLPCGREGPEGLHLSMENYCNKKA